MTEGSKSLEQKANLNSQKDSAFWKQSGETTKTAKQQVKQKGRSVPRLIGGSSGMLITSSRFGGCT